MEEIVHPKGKIYYSVGEVCEMFGVNASLLRFWEEEFPVLKIAKNSRGHRIYTTTDVDNLRLIYHLVKEQGMTLEGAKKRLRQNPEGVAHQAEIVERLRSIRNMLVALKAEMGEGVEVIDVDDEENDEAATTTPIAPTKEVMESPKTEAAQEVSPKVEAPKENLAAFKMENPTATPAPEEPRKPRAPKVGTLIGGDLFDPEDIRKAVAKQRSEEAKKQVVEQTLF
ncbi:MAG: MerR family transcriptional regulator [Tidjanibacter sp.]|nr:MerR family transcriptional regulator [Tidjanibacter sp.]